MEMRENPQKNASRSSYRTFATYNMASITICDQSNFSTTNSLMLARTSQHAAMPATAPPIPLPVSSMTFDRPSPHSKNPNANPAKRSSPIDATTPSITIATVNEANLNIGRNVALCATKKVVGLQNIQRKNEKSQRDGSRSASIRTLTGMRGNTLQSMKEMMAMVMKMIRKMERMRWTEYWKTSPLMLNLCRKAFSHSEQS